MALCGAAETVPPLPWAWDSAWGPSTHMGDWEEAAGFDLTQPWLLWLSDSNVPVPVLVLLGRSDSCSGQSLEPIRPLAGFTCTCWLWQGLLGE